MKYCLTILFCFCSLIALAQNEADTVKVQETSEANSQYADDYPYVHLDELLIGNHAGVWTNQSSGSAGNDFSIRVRGTSTLAGGAEPLYVINGFPFYNESRDNSFAFGAGVDLLSMIDPKNVKSIEVLSNIKATALYGSRGANGVILIETKDGRSARNRVEGEVLVGNQEALDRPAVLSASDYAQYLNEHALLNGQAAPYSQPGGFGNGTNWDEELYKKGSFRNYRITLNGSNDKSSYSVHGSFLDQKGLTVNSDLKRYNLQMRLQNQANEKLAFDSYFLFSRQESNGVVSNHPEDRGIVSGAYRFSPLLGPNDILNYSVDDGGNVLDGNGTALSLQSANTLNPVASANLASSSTKISRLLFNTQVNFDISENLRLNSTLGADGIFAEDFSFINSILQPGLSPGGSGANAKEQQLTWYNKSSLQFSKAMGDNDFTAKIGLELQASTVELLLGEASGFDNETLGFNSLVSGASKSSGSNLDEWQLVSFYGLAQYSINDTYEALVSIRSDASSRFGGDYEIFPALGLSADLVKAGVLSDDGLLSGLKVYAGFGKSGNQQATPYLRHSRLQQDIYYLGSERLKSFFPSRLANSALEMEKSTQFDIGAKIAISDWLDVKAEYYMRNTNNALIAVPLPSFVGVETGVTNGGEIKNSGIELTMTAKGGSDIFNWQLGLNVSTNSNEVVTAPYAFEHGASVNGIADWLTFREGEKIGSILGYQIDGLVQESDNLSGIATLNGEDALPGSYRYVDQNNDGIIDEADKTVLGSVTPSLFYGLNGALSAYGIEVSFLFQGVSGNDVVNFNNSILNFLDGSGNISQEAFDQRWSSGNTSATIPVRFASSDPVLDESLVESGSYLRLKFLSIGYSFNESLLEKLKLNQLKIYATGRNLFTSTNYSGVDPEVSLFASDAASMGADFGVYPNSRLLTIGLKIGL